MALVIDWVIVDCEDVEKMSAFWSRRWIWSTLGRVRVAATCCREDGSKRRLAMFPSASAKAGVPRPTLDGQDVARRVAILRQGHIDGWREMITTDAQERRYEARVSSPCSPDLAAWLLGGSLASA